MREPKRQKEKSKAPKWKLQRTRIIIIAALVLIILFFTLIKFLSTKYYADLDKETQGSIRALAVKITKDKSLNSFRSKPYI